MRIAQHPPFWCLGLLIREINVLFEHDLLGCVYELYRAPLITTQDRVQYCYQQMSNCDTDYHMCQTWTQLFYYFFAFSDFSIPLETAMDLPVLESQLHVVCKTKEVAVEILPSARFEFEEPPELLDDESDSWSLNNNNDDAWDDGDNKASTQINVLSLEETPKVAIKQRQITQPRSINAPHFVKTDVFYSDLIASARINCDVDLFNVDQKQVPFFLFFFFKKANQAEQLNTGY